MKIYEVVYDNGAQYPEDLYQESFLYETLDEARDRFDTYHQGYDKCACGYDHPYVCINSVELGTQKRERLYEKLMQGDAYYGDPYCPALPPVNHQPSSKTIMGDIDALQALREKLMGGFK